MADGVAALPTTFADGRTISKLTIAQLKSSLTAYTVAFPGGATKAELFVHVQHCRAAEIAGVLVPSWPSPTKLSDGRTITNLLVAQLRTVLEQDYQLSDIPKSAPKALLSVHVVACRSAQLNGVGFPAWSLNPPPPPRPPPTPLPKPPTIPTVDDGAGGGGDGTPGGSDGSALVVVAEQVAAAGAPNPFTVGDRVVLVPAQSIVHQWVGQVDDLWLDRDRSGSGTIKLSRIIMMLASGIDIQFDARDVGLGGCIAIRKLMR